MRTIAVIRIDAPDGRSWVFESSPGNKVLKSGSVSIAKNEKSRTLDFTIADPQGELANSIPAPKKNRVEVNAWFGSRDVRQVFSGTLSDHSFTWFPGELSLTATDKSKRLRKDRKNAVWSSQKADALVKSIADRYGMTVDLSRANLTDVELAQEVQNGETDWALLVRVLHQLGHDVRVIDQEVPSGTRGTPLPPTIQVVELGAPATDTLPVIQLGDTSGGAISIKQFTADTTPNILTEPVLEDVDSNAAQPTLDRFGLTVQSVDVPEYNAQELHRVALAQAKAKKIKEGSLQLLEARPELDTTKQVVLAGFGDAYSGVWNIEQMSHDLTNPSSPTKLDIWSG